MKSSVWEKVYRRPGLGSQNSVTAFIPLVLIVALLVGGVLGILGPYACAAAIFAMIAVIVIALHQDALTVTLIAALHLYVDWYLGLHLFAPVLAIAALCVFYLTRSARHPWTAPGALWLWILFLIITIYPAARGGVLMLYDAASFYPSDILGAFLMFWLGAIVVGDARHREANIRLFFHVFTIFAVLLAIHTIIQATTGTILFSSSHIDDFLARSDILYYQLAGTTTDRAGSFFIDPNWNGAFFALVFFLPLGLFVSKTSILPRICYLAEMALILSALMFTYSTGSWIAFIAGLMTFLIFVGRMRYRFVLPVIFLIAGTLIVLLFPGQVALQLQHAQGTNELSLRVAVWQTALRVIQAYPLTGVGLGHQAYLTRSNPYRVPGQFVALSHPHDSYLEWAGMAGIPVLLVFLALLIVALWQAWRNWRLVDVPLRVLIGSGITSAVTLSINSISINGWTHFALAPIGWLILGVVSSPLIREKYRETEGGGKLCRGDQIA